MIIYKYLEGWDKELQSNNNDADSVILSKLIKSDKDVNENFLTWCDLKAASSNHNVLPITQDQTDNIPKLARIIIEKILNSFDKDDCIYGLFSALGQAESRINPFIVTHNYCIKVENCSLSGEIIFNISPIYHLGPDYLEQHRDRYGAEVDENAILGLIELSAQELPPSEHRTFRLGIDAGIAFKESKIPHNKKLSLQLNTVNAGIMANLHCETQTTAKKFTWAMLGVEISQSGKTNNKSHAGGVTG